MNARNRSPGRIFYPTPTVQLNYFLHRTPVKMVQILSKLLVKQRIRGVAIPKFWGGKNFGGGKIFDFKRITLYCLEKRLSKHKMTMFSKN